MVGERPRPFGEALGFDPITSTLIFGEHDAVLVDAMTTVAEAEALADWVALHNRNLETIYITHAHFDHFYGLGILLDRFPGARAIATPKTLNGMQIYLSPAVQRLARRLFPGQIPTNSVAPEPYERETFTLEGQEFRIIELGHTDSADTTSLHVPSIGLIVAGDVVYNQCRMYVGDTTPESRKNWIAALDRLAALNPAMVVAGHKRPGAPDSPSTIQDTKRNLQDFDRLQKTAKSGPAALRSDDRAISALGSQSVLVDVRIPAAITFIFAVPCRGALLPASKEGWDSCLRPLLLLHSVTFAQVRCFCLRRRTTLHKAGSYGRCFLRPNLPRSQQRTPFGSAAARRLFAGEARLARPNLGNHHSDSAVYI